jgi:hypothetical protein
MFIFNLLVFHKRKQILAPEKATGYLRNIYTINVSSKP